MRFISFSTLLVLLASAASAETITIGHLASFAESSGASNNVRAECKLETRIPEYIVKAAKDDVSVIMTSDSLDNVEGLAMKVTITSVYAPGGGNWSGGKRVHVNVELTENGEVLEEKEFYRSSRTGFGTCAILKKITRVLGEDIVVWLRRVRS